MKTQPLNPRGVGNMIQQTVLPFMIEMKDAAILGEPVKP
jgi:hypothetical protein